MDREEAEHICYKIDNEGLIYFLTGYASPDAFDGTEVEADAQAFIEALENIEAFIEKLKAEHGLEDC